MTPTSTTSWLPALAALALAPVTGCDLLGPRVADEFVDGAPATDAAPVDAGGPVHVLPAGASVPDVATDPVRVAQIQAFDGLSDAALAMSGGVITRSTGKAAGATVRFWAFGPAHMVGTFAAKAPLYLLADPDGNGGFVVRADHPGLLDSIPGDVGYSAIRQIVYLPVTPAYAGQRLPSVAAVSEALALGLIDEPVPAGTWRFMPVVPPGTTLELGGAAAPAPPITAYADGVAVGAFVLGWDQPLRGGFVPVGQESRLLSGVATGMPPVLPASPDAQPVFQFGVPAAPPTTSPNYTPVVTQVDVRLASGVAPAAITTDAQLFQRASNGSISGHFVDQVQAFTVTTTVSLKQLQFVEGAQ